MLKVRNTTTVDRGTALLQEPVSTTNQVNALLNLGVRAANSHQTEKALAYLKQALTIDSNNEIGLLWMGYLATNPEDALSYFDRVLKINPNNLMARRYYEQSLSQTSSSVTSEYKAVAKKSDNTILWLGDLLVEQGLITYDQLQEALSRQKELSMKNKWKPIGELLVQMRYLKRHQLDTALQQQQEQRA